MRAKRRIIRRKIKKIYTSFPKEKFSIIYADPPWTFKNYNNKTATRWVGDHYSLLSETQLFRLDIDAIAEKDCVLFLWVTFPKMESGLRLIKAWGFTYKTVGFVWVKTNKKSASYFVGMGYYTRSNAEFCLLATRGKGLERKSKSVRQVVVAPRQEHSKKPTEVRDRIVELFGSVKRIELFAREKVRGWRVWGNEI